MGKHMHHRALATSLGITVAELKHVREVVAEAEDGLGDEPRARRRELLAERLHLTPAELTRLFLALANGANGRAERAVVQRLAREGSLVGR